MTPHQTLWHRFPMATETERLFPGKFFISTALEALEAKTAMSGELAVRYLQRAAMAGILIAVFYGAYFSTVATFSGLSLDGTPLTGIGKLVGALVFGWALGYNGFVAEDVTKALAMIMAVFIFAFLGLEHSVTNADAYVNDDSRFRK